MFVGLWQGNNKSVLHLQKQKMKANQPIHQACRMWVLTVITKNDHIIANTGVNQKTKVNLVFGPVFIEILYHPIIEFSFIFKHEFSEYDSQKSQILSSFSFLIFLNSKEEERSPLAKVLVVRTL